MTTTTHKKPLSVICSICSTFDTILFVPPYNLGYVPTDRNYCVKPLVSSIKSIHEEPCCLQTLVEQAAAAAGSQVKRTAKKKRK